MRGISDLLDPVPWEGYNISYSEFLSEYQIYFPREGDNPRAAGEWGYRLRGENKSDILTKTSE